MTAKRSELNARFGIDLNILRYVNRIKGASGDIFGKP
jgi:hypothetical protein